MSTYALLTIALASVPISSSAVKHPLRIPVSRVLPTKRFGISSVVNSEPSTAVTRPYLSTVILFRMLETVVSFVVNSVNPKFRLLPETPIVIPALGVAMKLIGVELFLES